MPPLLDAHNHLHDAWLTPHRPRILSDMTAVDIRCCVVNGTSEADWPQVAELCSDARRPASSTSTETTGSPVLLPSFGLHPWDVGNRSSNWQQTLLRHLDEHPTAFIGEIGVDRWILDRARPDDPRLTGLRRAPIEEQTEVFRVQLTLAAERNLPASIHCLDAFGALHDVLRSSQLPQRGFLLHAYSGSSELATAFAKLGAYFSFNGAFLEPRKARLRELYATLPANRLLVETDAPAMSLPASQQRYQLPATTDGESINHPANLAATYAALAELRGINLESLTTQVAANFVKLFCPAGSSH